MKGKKRIDKVFDVKEYTLGEKKCVSRVDFEKSSCIRQSITPTVVLDNGADVYCSYPVHVYV
jgi:hypothetical protein